MNVSHHKVSIRALADALSMSKSTVSRALNDYPDISAQTKHRVRTMADKLGYVPSNSAQRLARGLSGTIGFVIPMGEDLTHAPFLSTFLTSLTEGLSQNGLDLVVHGSRLDRDPVDGYRRLLHAGKVDGFVVIRTRADDPRIRFLIDSQVPFISHGRTEYCDEHAWFDIDAESAFKVATQLLIEAGHRQLAFIGETTELYSAQLRLKGFRQALNDYGVAQPPIILPGDLTDENGFKQGMVLLKTHPEVTGIVCVNDAMAFGVLEAARQSNRTVPDTLSVIGYDNVPYGGFSSPPLTTFNNLAPRAGDLLAEALVKLIAGGSFRDHQTLWTTDLIQRKTVAPLVTTPSKPTME